MTITTGCANAHDSGTQGGWPASALRHASAAETGYRRLPAMRCRGVQSGRERTGRPQRGAEIRIRIEAGICGVVMRIGVSLVEGRYFTTSARPPASGGVAITGASDGAGTDSWVLGVAGPRRRPGGERPEQTSSLLALGRRVGGRGGARPAAQQRVQPRQGRRPGVAIAQPGLQGQGLVERAGLGVESGAIAGEGTAHLGIRSSAARWACSAVRSRRPAKSATRARASRSRRPGSVAESVRARRVVNRASTSAASTTRRPARIAAISSHSIASVATAAGGRCVRRRRRAGSAATSARRRAVAARGS